MKNVIPLFSLPNNWSVMEMIQEVLREDALNEARQVAKIIDFANAKHGVEIKDYSGGFNCDH